MLDLWVLKAISNSIFFTKDTLCEKWTQFINLVGVPKNNCFDLSLGQLKKYKKQYRLKVFKWHGKTATIDLYIIDKKYVQLGELFKEYNY